MSRNVAPRLRSQRNLIGRSTEHWRPPLFPPQGRPGLVAVLRRYFDLQAGSIWNDLTTELAGVTGTALDVGCGAQPYRVLFPPDVTYLGLDTVDARPPFGYDMPDTRYFAGTRWPVEEGIADFVLCTEPL